MPTAVITGVTGQDGGYLARLLVDKGYTVVGVTRRPPDVARPLLGDVGEQVVLRQGELDDDAALAAILRESAPDEIYHLASQSVVRTSWEAPVETAEATAVGAVRVLEGVRRHAPRARLLMASSCEMFGRPVSSPQSEATPLQPVSPYGAAKAFAHWMSRCYREVHGVFVSSAILFNHESPRRGVEFVTRKITDGVARIAAGRQSELRLGNLDVRRDWGFAGDYVEAMWRMLQHPEGDDFVIGTGVSHSVRALCDAAFRVAGLDYRDFVVTDPALHRPAEAEALVADASKARRLLGWAPAVSFPALVTLMVEADLERVRGAPS